MSSHIFNKVSNIEAGNVGRYLGNSIITVYMVGVQYCTKWWSYTPTVLSKMCSNGSW